VTRTSQGAVSLKEEGKKGEKMLFTILRFECRVVFDSFLLSLFFFLLFHYSFWGWGFGGGGGGGVSMEYNIQLTPLLKVLPPPDPNPLYG
jgi:hypothetical protein